MRVLISGAGPTGMSAALALCAAGHDVVIADRSAGITNESRAVAVNRNSMTLLRDFGVTDAILAEGAVLRAARIMLNGKTLTRIIVPGSSQPLPTAVGLPQSRTEALLERALHTAGVEVMWSHELQTVSDDGTAVHATFLHRDTGETSEISADYALGADGSRSATRTALGIGATSEPLPENWSLADVVADWPFDEQAVGALSDTGAVLFMVTLGDGRHRLISNRPKVLDAAKPYVSVHRVDWSSDFNIQLSVVDVMGRGRVCLAGDAAHTHTPVGGRGMNLGIADAFAFANAVETGDFELYREERLKAAKRTVKATTRAYRLLTATGLAKRTLRNGLLSAAGLLTRAMA